jgi:hypothetical protein
MNFSSSTFTYLKENHGWSHKSRAMVGAYMRRRGELVHPGHVPASRSWLLTPSCMFETCFGFAGDRFRTLGSSQPHNHGQAGRTWIVSRSGGSRSVQMWGQRRCSCLSLGHMLLSGKWSHPVELAGVPIKVGQNMKTRESMKTPIVQKLKSFTISTLNHVLPFPTWEFPAANVPNLSCP